MTAFFRRHLVPMLVAFVTAAVIAGGPALAEVIADYARDADKVDGRHAVSAEASVENRKAKLVATDATTGRLPNNIIAVAPDSAKLNGYSHGQLRSLHSPIHGAWTGGTASIYSEGLLLLASSTSSLRTSFVLPPDHEPGTPVFAHIVYREFSEGACSWYVVTRGSRGPENGTTTTQGGESCPRRPKA